jgi:hypothetical protein
MARRTGPDPGTGPGGAQTDRRSFLRGTAAGVAAAAGAVAGLPATSGAARSAPRDLPNPPGPGERYAFPFRAARTPLSGPGLSGPGLSEPALSGSSAESGFAARALLDFQGEIGFQVTDADPQHPWNVHLRITRFRATADGGQLGQVTLDLGRTSPEGMLVVTSERPARWRHTVLLDLAMTVENPPAGETDQVDGQPLVLQTRSPAELVGELDVFPPQGSDYALRRPVELVRAGGGAGAELSRFPMRVGIA